jgi:hypothetical protein
VEVSLDDHAQIHAEGRKFAAPVLTLHTAT